MSVRFLSRVWDTHCENHAQKLILLALADNADDHGVSWPSLRTISRKCDLCERSVRYGLRQLCRKGHIKITFRRDKKGDPTTSLYQILCGATNAPPLGQAMPDPGATNAPRVGHQMPPNRQSEPSVNRQGEGKPPRLFTNELEKKIKRAEGEIELLKARYPYGDTEKAQVVEYRKKIRTWTTQMLEQ